MRRIPINDWIGDIQRKSKKRSRICIFYQLITFLDILEHKTNSIAIPLQYVTTYRLTRLPFHLVPFLRVYV